MRARGWRTRSAARELWVESLERFFFFFFFNYSRNERKSLLAPDTAARTPGQLPACEVAACFPRLTKTLVGAGWRVGEGLSANFCTQTREAMRKAKRAIGDRRGLRAPTHPASLRPPPAPPPPSGVPLAARGVGSPRKGLCGAGGASLGARAMHKDPAKSPHV